MTQEATRTLQEVGLLIQLARKRRKMSLVEIAKRSGFDRRTISQMEAGHPGVSLGVFIQLLSILNLLPGLAVALDPKNDISAVELEVRRTRSKLKSRKKISKDEVNF